MSVFDLFRDNANRSKQRLNFGECWLLFTCLVPMGHKTPYLSASFQISPPVRDAFQQQRREKKRQVGDDTKLN
jgi:hypothetical protein